MPSLPKTPATTPRDAPSSRLQSTRVIVWPPENSPRTNLDAFLRAEKRKGWRVRRREPRVLEGPMYGALVVLERSRAEERLRRRPIRRSTDFKLSPKREADAEV